MKTKIKTITIRLKDYQELRSVYPGIYNESLADYFGRLISYMVVNSELQELPPIRKEKQIWKK